MRILITAGGTSEAIDDVRAITNTSSGALGVQIHHAIYEKYSSKNALENQVDLYYLHGYRAILPTINTPEFENLCIQTHLIPTTSTADVEHAIKDLLSKVQMDVIIHLMAISDYQIQSAIDINTYANQLLGYIHQSPTLNQEDLVKWLATHSNSEYTTKHSSKNGLMVTLTPTPKISELIRILNPSAKLITFKLLSHVTEENLIQVASAQEERYGCHMVVANDLKNIRDQEHKALIIQKGTVIARPNTKREIAEKLADLLL